MNTFGSHLTRLRRSRHLLQKELAKNAGIDNTYLAQLERDRRGPPKEKVLKMILDALDASTEEVTQIQSAAKMTLLVSALQNHCETEGVEVLLQIARQISEMPASDAKAFQKEIEVFLNSRLPSMTDESPPQNIYTFSDPL